MVRHFFVLLALLFCACEQDPSSPRSANGATRIVLITLDTLRHDSFFSPAGEKKEAPKRSAYRVRPEVSQ